MTDAPSDDPTFHRVADAAALDPGSATIVSVQGVELALFTVDDAHYAIENTCPHRGGPLGSGGLDGTCVRCPWHGWEIDVTTGEHVRSDAGVETYDVAVDGDGVYVRVA